MEGSAVVDGLGGASDVRWLRTCATTARMCVGVTNFCPAITAAALMD